MSESRDYCERTGKVVMGQREASRVSKKYHNAPYRCPYCHGWHTTKQKQDRSKSRRLREKGLFA